MRKIQLSHPAGYWGLRRREQVLDGNRGVTGGTSPEVVVAAAFSGIQTLRACTFGGLWAELPELRNNYLREYLHVGRIWRVQEPEQKMVCSVIDIRLKLGGDFFRGTENGHVRK